MPEILSPPESVADAIVIVRSLSDAELQPIIRKQFGTPLYDDTFENALAWQGRLDKEEHPDNEEILDLAWLAKTYEPGCLDANLQCMQRTAPGAFHDIIAEPTFFPDVEPRPFDTDESKVVLTALRLTVESARPGEQALAADFLTRNPPYHRTRTAGFLAAAGVTGLLMNSLRLLK